MRVPTHAQSGLINAMYNVFERLLYLHGHLIILEADAATCSWEQYIMGLTSGML